jgi:hypothetical protein
VCLSPTPPVAYLCLVRSMDAVSIYRAFLIVRGSWTVLEWLFDWGPKRLDSFTLLHPYASLFAHAIAVAFLLVILTGPVVLLPLGAVSVCFASCARGSYGALSGTSLYLSALIVFCYGQLADARVDRCDHYNVFSATHT